MKRFPALCSGVLCLALLLAPAVFPAGIYEIKYGGADGTQTVTGVVSAVESSFRFFIADDSAPYHAIYINQTEYGPEIGDEVTVTGSVRSVSGRIQLQDITSYTVNSVGNPVHAPIELTVSQLLSDLDAYEGSLVKLINPLTVTDQNAGSNTWRADDGTGWVTINTALDYNYFPRNGDQLTAIAGIVKKTAAASFQLQPRFTADLWGAPDVIPHYALKGTVVTMDDARSVKHDHYLVIRGDEIVEVAESAPVGIDVIDVDGLIFPGLISTHDHPTWNVFDFIPFPLPYDSPPAPAPYFRERNDWARNRFGDTIYREFQIQKGGFGQDDEVIRLTEVRLASSGATVLQGAGSSQTGRLGLGIIHGERFPGRVQTRVIGATDSTAAGYWAERHDRANKGILHRYMPHLGETTNAGPTMADQWSLWQGYDSFDGRDTLIHGMNIPAGDFALFNTHGEESPPRPGRPRRTVLSWAAKSNMLLYNATADIPGALANNAIVCLAPDWTPSGMPNMLAELNFARSVDRAKGWNLETRAFIDMVTRNAAIGFGQLWRMGTLEPGKIANLMVIDHGPGDPYDNLMMVAGGGEDPDYRGGPKDVRLTVVAGRPIYGDGDLLNTANFPFLWEDNIEDLTICGVVKKLKLARRNPGYLPGITGEKFQPMYLDLWARYQRSDQYPADFLPVDPCGAVPPTPMPTPSPPPGTYVITSSSDDAHQHISNYSDNAEAVWVGRHTVSSGYNSGFRFNNIQVPPGSNINEAYLVFTQYFRDNTRTPKLQIAAHNVNDSQTFSSTAGPLYRPLTSARVNWTMPPAAFDAEITTPDIKSVIQEIVDRPGWNEGNSISIILAADEPAVDNRRRVWAYDGYPELAARLVIVSGPTPVPAPTPAICTRISEGFDDFTAEDGWIIPAGWSFSGIGSGDVYTAEGDYGYGSPSLKFDADGDNITTPVFAVGEWLQFWAKGQGTDSTSTLFIEENYAGWVPLASIQPLPTTGTLYTGLTLNPSTNQVRFTYLKSAGDLALDDILVKCYISPTPPLPTTPTPVPVPTPEPGDAIVLYTFTGPTLAPEEVSPAVTASNFNVSQGSILYGSWDAADWAALGSGVPYVRSSDGWDAGSMELGKYFYFTITPENPEGVTVRRIDFLYRIPAADEGPTEVAVVADDTLISVVDPVGFDEVIPVTIGLDLEVTEETTFKIVGWGAPFDSGEFRVDDIRLGGDAGPTPDTTPTPSPLDYTLVDYAFTGETFSPTELAADVVASDFDVSTGTVLFGTRDEVDWSALGSGIPYARSGSGWGASSWTDGKNYYFRISPEAPYRLLVNEFDFLYRIPNWDSAPEKITVAYDDTEIETIEGMPFFTVTPYAIDNLGLVLTGETTFKVVGWGAQSATGTAELRIDDVRLGGRVLPQFPTPTPTVPLATPTPTPTPAPDICTRIDEGFDGYDAGVRPAGWTFFGCDQDTDTYTTAGNFGISSPSIRLDTDGDYIETAEFNAGEWLSFWVKGQGTDATSSLLVEEYYAAWATVTEVRPLPLTGTVIAGLPLNPYSNQLRFTYQKSSGDLAFDDVLVTCFLTPTPTVPPTPIPTATPTVPPTPIPTATPELTPTPRVTLVNYPFTGNSVAPTEVPANVTASDFGISEGTLLFGTWDSDDWAAMGGSGVPYARSQTHWDAASWPQAKHYYFRVAPVGPHRLRVNEIEFFYRIPDQPSSPRKMTIAVGETEIETIDLLNYDTVLAYSRSDLNLTVAAETTFKIAGWAAQSRFTFGEIRIDDVRLGGFLLPAATPPPPSPTPTASLIPTPSTTPTPVSTEAPWIFDYDGDGTSDLAIFRPSSGLWAIRGVTRVYFGSWRDEPVPGDYSGDGTTNVAVFRDEVGRWAVRGLTRYYFGRSGDIPVPGDYSGDGTAVPGIFRDEVGLWAIRGVTRVYFGKFRDEPFPGYYAPDGRATIAIYRPPLGLWAIRDLTRVYFGTWRDYPVPGDYTQNEIWDIAVFRPDIGRWAIRGITRIYFGRSGDFPLPASYVGEGRDRLGIFRPSSGLWAVRGLTRVYFGAPGDEPVTR